MEQFERYLVLGNNGTTAHSYSTEAKFAFQSAVSCARHWSINGDVYGVYKNGHKELVWKNERVVKKVGA